MQTVLLISSAFLILGIYAVFSMYFNHAWKNAKPNSLTHKTGPGGLTVIIPFRNEAANIPQLLSSLCQQSGIDSLEWEVLFINDHSVDDGPTLIEHAKSETPQFRLINNTGLGKKEALLEGIRNAKYSCIVTTDADCTFSSNWLFSIAACFAKKDADMIIAPVCMKGGRSFWQRFSETEFLALQVVGGGSALSGKPLLCNGANLAFQKPDEQPELNATYKSGEDMFLLAWMKKQQKCIHYLKSPEAIVQTSGPVSFTDIFRQRARWLSKAGGYKDTLLQVFSLTIFFTNLMTYVLLAHTFFYPAAAVYWLLFFTIKTSLDFWQVKLGANFFHTRISVAPFIGMQFIYPLYMLAITGLAFLQKPSWKDANS